jgi:hypothetical protein
MEISDALPGADLIRASAGLACHSEPRRRRGIPQEIPRCARDDTERSHRKDLDDVESMIRHRLVEPRRLAELFEQVEEALYRYPAVDPKGLRAAVARLASR